MAAGLFGYLGYDMVRLMERLPPPNPDVLGVPDAILVRPTVMVVFDAVRDEISLITPVRPQPGVSAKAAYETALARLDEVAAALERPLPIEERHDPRVRWPSRRSRTPRLPNTKRWSRGRKEYIRAGDIFQVVLSQRFEAPFRLPRLCALPGAAARQSGAVPVLPRLRGVPDRLLQPRNPGARARRRGDDPAHRRHAPARRDPGRGPAPRRGACSPIRRSAPST